MSFTYDLSTSNGKVRLKIADTGGVAPGATATSGYAFEDEELAEFITEGGTVQAASILAVQALLASRSARVKRFAVGGQSYDDTAQVAGLSALLALLGGGLPTVGTSTLSPREFDRGYDEPTSTFPSS